MVVKLVISDPTSGLSVQKEIADEALKGFMGAKIGDTLKGELVDLHGYEFVLTGGSDYCGFPMRLDVPGVGRKKILAYHGVGMKKGLKGMLQRKTVCGNTVHAKIAQLNLKVVKKGTSNPFEEVEKKKTAKEKPAVKAEEPKVAEKKEDVPKEPKGAAAENK